MIENILCFLLIDAPMVTVQVIFFPFSEWKGTLQINLCLFWRNSSVDAYKNVIGVLH